MTLTTEVRVKILPDFTVYDREVKKRTSISITSSKSESKSGGTLASAVSVGGAAALGGGIGAIIGSAFSKSLNSALDQIENLINQSVFYQKSMDALLKLISVGIRFLGDIIGGVVLTVFKLLLPLVKVLNLLWAPFQKQMLMGIKTAFEKNKEPLDALIDSSMVIANTVSSFFGLLNNAITTTLAKTFVGAIVELGQILVITLAGGFISVVNAIFSLAISLAASLGQKQLAGGLEQTRTGIVDQVGSGAAALVGGLEVLKETFNITTEQYLNSFIEGLYRQNGALAEVGITSSGVSTMLADLAGTFDSGFGQKVSTVLIAVQTKADELRTTLSETETATFNANDVLGQLSQVVSESLTPDVGTATETTTKWDEILNTLITNLFNASNNTNLLGSSVTLLNLASTPAEQAVLALKKIIDDLGTSARTALAEIETALNKIKSKVKLPKIPENVSGAISDLSQFLNPAINSGYLTNLVNEDFRSRAGLSPLNDFIMRPGSPAASFSAQDTVIGVKDPSVLGGGKGTTIINNIQGIGDRQLEELIIRVMEKSMRSSYTSGYGAQLR